MQRSAGSGGPRPPAWLPGRPRHSCQRPAKDRRRRWRRAPERTEPHRAPRRTKRHSDASFAHHRRSRSAGRRTRIRGLRRRKYAGATVVAAILHDTAVQTEHFTAARELVKAVHVLSDHGHLASVFLERCHRPVPGVGRAFPDDATPVFVEIPDQRRISFESFASGEFRWIVACPKAGQRIAKGRDPGIRTHPRPGKKHRPLRLPGQSAGLLEEVVHRDHR